MAAFAAEIRRLFPGCPAGRAGDIAAHAALRGSGRVGRSAAGRALTPTAVTAAVTAAVRHTDTEYDGLLMRGVPRAEARRAIAGAVAERLRDWAEPGGGGGDVEGGGGVGGEGHIVGGEGDIEGGPGPGRAV